MLRFSFDQFAKKNETCVSSACAAEMLLATDHVWNASRLVSAVNLCVQCMPASVLRMVLMWTVRWLLSMLQEMKSLEMACLDMEAMLACCRMPRAE